MLYYLVMGKEMGGAVFWVWHEKYILFYRVILEQKLYIIYGYAFPTKNDATGAVNK